jgi:preprotein translocase subunit SecG
VTEFIETPLTVLHTICCLFLILVVLLQPGKSGGLGALSGAGAQQVFGGRGAGNFLTKTTWVSATVFFVTSAALAYLSTSTDTSLKQKSAEYDTQGRGHLPPSATTPAKTPEKAPAEK